MKLSTGDIVEIEVCINPVKVSYMLNGLRYDTKTELIKEFLLSKGLFTPDFDAWSGLEEQVGIYRISLFNRLTCLFKPPLYWVEFDESLCSAVENKVYFAKHQEHLMILCEYLEALLSPRTIKQTCTIYS